MVKTKLPRSLLSFLVGHQENLYMLNMTKKNSYNNNMYYVEASADFNKPKKVI